MEGNNRLLEGPRASSKDSLWCTSYCKKLRHTPRRGARNSTVSPQILKILFGQQKVIKEEEAVRVFLVALPLAKTAGALDNPRYKDVEGRRGSGEAGRPWIPDSGNFQCSDG